MADAMMLLDRVVSGFGEAARERFWQWTLANAARYSEIKSDIVTMQRLGLADSPIQRRQLELRILQVIDGGNPAQDGGRSASTIHPSPRHDVPIRRRTA